MSRCFPFPPPGYEKKIHVTHSDPLKKEKHREKKHKKDKKDRVKKEEKENNVKDKNDGKSRDKKYKKEKHRDKKKGKEGDKGRSIDNPITSGETRLEFQSEGHNGQNVIQDRMVDGSVVSEKTLPYNDMNHGHYSSYVREPNGVKFLPDVDRSTSFDTKRDVGQMREKIIVMDHKRSEVGGTFHNHVGNTFEDFNLAQELDRRLKNEAEQPYDQVLTANKFIGANQKKDVRVIQSVSMDNMERCNNKITTSIGRYVEEKSPVVKMVSHASVPAQGNHDRVPRPSSGGEKIEGQERINRQEDELQPRGRKRKDNERNGERKDRGKNKCREKERKEDKGNSRSDQKSAEQGTRHKKDMLGAPNKEMLPSGVNSCLSYDGNLNQGKEILTNGISHVTGPSKLSRPSSSLHLQYENGRMPEPREIPLKPSPDHQGATDIYKVDMVGKVNGIIETLVQRPATEQVVQPRPRSPHPDTKRLIEILSVPKIEELSEIDDSGWLNSSKEGPEKKHKVDSSRTSNVADMPQVWSKATTIQSADVYALPYVIPY